MDKKYFHRLNIGEWMDAASNDHKPEDYIRPDWCSFEDALGRAGCMSLLRMNVRSIHDCYGCDCCSEDM